MVFQSSLGLILCKRSTLIVDRAYITPKESIGQIKNKIAQKKYIRILEYAILDLISKGKCMYKIIEINQSNWCFCINF